jgi:hypothetical protein
MYTPQVHAETYSVDPCTGFMIMRPTFPPFLDDSSYKIRKYKSKVVAKVWVHGHACVFQWIISHGFQGFVVDFRAWHVCREQPDVWWYTHILVIWYVCMYVWVWGQSRTHCDMMTMYVCMYVCVYVCKRTIMYTLCELEAAHRLMHEILLST